MKIKRFEDVPPDLILAKIFQPYRFITRTMGILPIQISPTGQASYKFFSWSSVYTLLVYFTFIFDSSILVPMYLFLVQLNNSDSSSSGSQQQQSQSLNHVAHLMFVSCQYFGAALIYILSPWKIPSFVKYWNKIQKIVGKVSVLNPSLNNRNQDFHHVYLGGKWKMRIWFATSLSFSLYCVYIYGSGFELYIGPNPHPVIYWIMYSGLCIFPIFLCFHILHSIIFSTMCSVLQSCFTVIKNYCESSRSYDKFGDTTKLYREINELVKETGRVGGIYVAIEVLIMIICVTMNSFFLVSKFHGVGESAIYLAMIIPYCVWFHWICSVGESLINEGLQCCAAVKRLASKDLENREWALIEEPEEVSATGYFPIRKRLFTTVMRTIATYLIVLLQFKFSSVDSTTKEKECREMGFVNVTKNNIE